MPLYEFQCKKCGHRFERIQSFSAEDPKECPVCQGEVERLISTPARPQFKGSGFYTTDYASPTKSDSGSGSSGSASAPKPSGGSDSASSDKGSSAKTESTSTPAASPSPAKSE
jgi:putative FmdB family regulatory protein